MMLDPRSSHEQCDGDYATTGSANFQRRRQTVGAAMSTTTACCNPACLGDITYDLTTRDHGAVYRCPAVPTFSMVGRRAGELAPLG